jgi:hypothetical protein
LVRPLVVALPEEDGQRRDREAGRNDQADPIGVFEPQRWTLLVVAMERQPRGVPPAAAGEN